MNSKEYEESLKKIDKEYEDFRRIMVYFYILIILAPPAGLGVGYLIKTFL